MNFTRTLIAAALIATSGATFAQAIIDQNRALAGSITPGDTAGFPVTISQPGSYKLTSNLFVPSGASGIIITSPNVTIDLNGFSVIGPVTCSQDGNTRVVTCQNLGAVGFHGIGTGVGSVIKNGTVQGFSASGVNADSGGELLERLHLTQNSYGVDQVPAIGSLRIIDSVFTLNRLDGAFLFGGVVSGSRFQGNGRNGVKGLKSLLVQDSVSFANFATGFLDVSVKGTVSQSNGTNRSGVAVMGVNNNVDGFATY